MRFDSPEHLEAWAKTGKWPEIHTPVTNMALNMLYGMRLVDLGCSYGLLGARLRAVLGLQAVLGIDADADVLEAARVHAVPIHLTHMRIEPTTVGIALLRQEVERFNADSMVCRRILPELFGENLGIGRAWAGAMVAAGIKEMIVQGRVDSARSTNPLHNVDAEIEILAGAYALIRKEGSVAYLRAR